MPARLPQVGSTYYFRRAVPLELRPYFLTERGKPRTEFMVSLGVKDLATAKDRWLVEAVRVATLLNEARAKLNARVAPVSAKPWVYDPNAGPFRSQEEQEMEEEAAQFFYERDEELAADPAPLPSATTIR